MDALEFPTDGFYLVGYTPKSVSVVRVYSDPSGRRIKLLGSADKPELSAWIKARKPLWSRPIEAIKPSKAEPGERVYSLQINSGSETLCVGEIRTSGRNTEAAALNRLEFAGNAAGADRVWIHHKPESDGEPINAAPEIPAGVRRTGDPADARGDEFEPD